MNGKIEMRMDFKPLTRFIKKDPKNWHEALKRGAIQFLTWANTGTSRVPKKPPIRWGILRGSSSAFIGSELIQVYPQTIKGGSGEVPTPNKQFNAPNLTATFGWNTAYATRMHEWKGNWGQFTEQDGDAGNKWLEQHLKGDKDPLMDMVAREYKKVAGT